MNERYKHVIEQQQRERKRKKTTNQIVGLSYYNLE